MWASTAILQLLELRIFITRGASRRTDRGSRACLGCPAADGWPLLGGWVGGLGGWGGGEGGQRTDLESNLSKAANEELKEGLKLLGKVPPPPSLPAPGKGGPCRAQEVAAASAVAAASCAGHQSRLIGRKGNSPLRVDEPEAWQLATLPCVSTRQ